MCKMKKKKSSQNLHDVKIVYYATRAYSITLRTSGERADRPSV